MQRTRYYNTRRFRTPSGSAQQCLPNSYFNNNMPCPTANAQYITGDTTCCCNNGSSPDQTVDPSACIVTKPTSTCLDSSYSSDTPCQQPQAAYTMGDKSCCCNWGLMPDKLINPSVCNNTGPLPPPPPPPSEGPYGCSLDNTCQLMTTGGMYGRDCNGVGSTCATSLARCNATSKICEPAPSDATGADIYPWATCDARCNMPLYECGSNNTCQQSTTGTYTSNSDCLATSPCGETTLDIEKGPFIVPKPLSTHKRIRGNW